MSDNIINKIESGGTNFDLGAKYDSSENELATYYYNQNNTTELEVTQLDIDSTPTADSTNMVTSGGVYAYAAKSTTTATLAASEWSSSTNQLTVSVTGVTATNIVIVSPAPASTIDWAAAQVYCWSQGDGELTFACTTIPTVELTANILIM